MNFTCPDLNCGLGCTPIPSSEPEDGDPIAMLVGEAPGNDERLLRRFFIGKAGKELDNYLGRAGIPRYRLYVTNILKCQPPKNRDPLQSEIKSCTALLNLELALVQPRFIIAVGRFAARFFLGDVDMETVHGIPFVRDGVTIIPVYHPAAGLHDTTMMTMVMADFLAVKQVMMGQWRRREIGHGKYREVGYGEDLSWLDTYHRMAIDTETVRDKAWCLSFCVDGREGLVVMKDNPSLQYLRDWVRGPLHTVYVHNAMFDIRVLREMGVEPVNLQDTMVMAYLLQSEPQGLKQLAYRHLGLEMKSYQDMVGSATQNKALAYLCEVSMTDWPKPAPIAEEVKGVVKVRQPQSINTKVKRVMTDLGKNPDLDLRERWNNMDGTDQVVEEMGVLEPSYLDELPRDEAIDYAGEDAYATYHLALSILEPRICSLRLEPVLERDMGVIQMVSDMQDAGMQVNLPYFYSLRSDYLAIMEGLRANIARLAHDINPGSDQQVIDLLFSLRVIPVNARVKGAVDRARLEELADKHPVVPLISEWRAYSKLISSFLDVLPRKTGPDGRVRTTLRVTRVVTGRLSSSSPNLMAQPVRTEQGRRVRGGFVAKPGCIMASLDYCLSPGVKVLTHDLRWIPAGSIREGDMLWGVEEDPPRRGVPRKMACGVVERVGRRTAACSLLVMEDGREVICSDEHPWLARNRRSYREGAYHWVKTKELDHRYEIWDAVDVWEGDRSWDSGYLAGAFDGEGSISVGRGLILTFTQKEGTMLRSVMGMLSKRGYSFHSPLGKVGAFPNSGVVYNTWISNRRDISRFLGEVRPKRLLEKAWSLFEGRVPPRGNARVKEVIPVGESEVVSIRTSTGTFIAEGMVCHNSQIEMRVVAHLSRDPEMTRVFRDREDIHTATASRMFGIAPDQLNEMKHRYPAKRVGFGILNLISPRKLLRELSLGGAEGWTEQGCTKLIQDWFGVYSGVAEWIEGRKQEARRTGMVRDMWGRLRLVPEVMSVNKNVVEAGIRQAVNAPIQMSATGVIKEAMVQLVPIYRMWNAEGMEVTPLLAIHDDLVWEIREDILGDVLPVIQHVMENCVSMSVPIKVDPKVGPDWLHMTKWKGGE